jgi:hypothetical protein
MRQMFAISWLLISGVASAANVIVQPPRKDPLDDFLKENAAKRREVARQEHEKALQREQQEHERKMLERQAELQRQAAQQQQTAQQANENVHPVFKAIADPLSCTDSQANGRLWKEMDDFLRVFYLTALRDGAMTGANWKTVVCECRFDEIVRGNRRILCIRSGLRSHPHTARDATVCSSDERDRRGGDREARAKVLEVNSDD